MFVLVLLPKERGLVSSAAMSAVQVVQAPGWGCGALGCVTSACNEQCQSVNKWVKRAQCWLVLSHHKQGASISLGRKGNPKTAGNVHCSSQAACVHCALLAPSCAQKAPIPCHAAPGSLWCPCELKSIAT